MFEIVQDEDDIAQSHLSADPALASLQRRLRHWHSLAIYRLDWHLLAKLYPLLHQVVQLSAAKQQELVTWFAFTYALPKRTELHLLADALCQATFWQRYEPICHWLSTGNSAVRYEAVIAAWLLRNQLPWPLAVPALLNNVCDKIFDIELSFAFAWHLLQQAEQEPMACMRQFQPSTEMFVEQYHERISALEPEVNLHLNELEKFGLTVDGACS
jgi:hypothetical protein